MAKMETMTAQQAAEWGKTLSFETVWATITKLGERIEETDRIVKENAVQMRETDKKIQETTATVDKMAEKVDKVTKRVCA
jgi:methyl-accepting chemotaxis protein